MPALWLDYQQERPFPWAGSVLLALALAALILAVSYYRELEDKADTWEKKLELIERGQGLRTPAGGREPEGLALEVKRANEVLRKLTLPWEDLLQAVEAAAGKKVALLALEPDTERHVVKISGEARDFGAVLNYVTQLEAQEVFGPVYLQSHQVQERDPDKPVRFSLLAVWRGKP